MTIIQEFEKWHFKLKRLTFLINIVLDYKNLKYFIISKQFNCQ